MQDDGDIGGMISGMSSDDLSFLQQPTATVPAAASTDALNVDTTGLTDQNLIDAGVVGPNAPGGGGILNWIGNNPLQAAGLVAGGGLLASEAFGSGGAEQQQLTQLSQAAGEAGSTATALRAPLQSGVLPPGAQQVVNNARTAGLASAASAAATTGMGGKSTAYFDARQAAIQNAQVLQYGIEQDMFKQALGYSQLQANDLQALIKDQMQKDQNFSNALNGFVKALAGMAGGGGNTTGSGAPAPSSDGGDGGGFFSDIATGVESIFS